MEMKPPFDETVFKNLKASTAQSPKSASSNVEEVTANSNANQTTPEPSPVIEPPLLATPSGPPQSPSQSTLTFELLLPASYRVGDGKGKFEIVAASTAYVKDDLSVKRLNNIHGWLWLAGRPMPPRPLNYQLANSREIIVCEQMDLHLVWAIPRRIFLKPIPRYLLDHQFWKDNLAIEQSMECSCSRDQTQDNEKPHICDTCERRELYKCALGFLQSYAALIQYESDFYIAKENHLIHENLTWESWIKLINQLLRNKNDDKVNKRYEYGELRLSRLNKVYWLHGRLRGYRFPFQSYGEMFQANIAPIAGITVYIALALTAMQVGLATDTLAKNDAFQNASYGFTVFSILAPIILVLSVVALVVVFFFYNWIATVILRRKIFKEKDQL